MGQNRDANPLNRDKFDESRPQNAKSLMKRALVGAALGVLVMDAPAFAADMPLKAPRIPFYEWTGLYIGAHAGFGGGHSNATLLDPVLTQRGNNYNGLIGGVQGGYNYRSSSGVLVGFEADISFPNYLTSNSVVSSLTTVRSDVTEQWDYIGTARGRIGYAAGPWLFYATGGFAWAGERFLNTPAAGNDEKRLNVRPGWAAGAGV